MVSANDSAFVEMQTRQDSDASKIVFTAETDPAKDELDAASQVSNTSL